jgi:hypothetical protein
MDGYDLKVATAKRPGAAARPARATNLLLSRSRCPGRRSATLLPSVGQLVQAAAAPTARRFRWLITDVLGAPCAHRLRQHRPMPGAEAPDAMTIDGPPIATPPSGRRRRSRPRGRPRSSPPWCRRVGGRRAPGARPTATTAAVRRPDSKLSSPNRTGACRQEADDLAGRRARVVHEIRADPSCGRPPTRPFERLLRRAGRVILRVIDCWREWEAG